MDAPKEALAALLSHEAIHQDKDNSINEETYCWTLEAAVWTNMCDKNEKLQEIAHPLVDRENTIKRFTFFIGYSPLISIIPNFQQSLYQQAWLSKHHDTHYIVLFQIDILCIEHLMLLMKIFQ